MLAKTSRRGFLEMLGVAAATPVLGASEALSIEQASPAVLALPQLTSTTAWFLAEDSAEIGKLYARHVASELVGVYGSGGRIDGLHKRIVQHYTVTAGPNEWA